MISVLSISCVIYDLHTGKVPVSNFKLFKFRVNKAKDYHHSMARLQRILSCFIVYIKLILVSSLADLELDPNGYIIYCPCMGRFGNQAEQFLGSLNFAKHLNRTLVLPPFIEYQSDRTIKFVPFEDYIQVEPLKQFHRVVTLEEFLERIAPTEWPEGKRKIFCYGGRSKKLENQCNAFEGNPFKPFWHHHNIKIFDETIFYEPLYTTTSQTHEWVAKFRNEKVLAFPGAPSSFPASIESVTLQYYVHFSDKVSKDATDYRKSRFSAETYIGVHLRHGSDWEKACQHLKHNMTQLFSSHQCTKRLPVTSSIVHLPFETCLPSKTTIANEITIALKSMQETTCNTVFIATDYDDHGLWMFLSKQFPQVDFVTPSATYRAEKMSSTESASTPLIDLYLLTHSDYFIGNCISSFTAFSSRIREYQLDMSHRTKFFGERLMVRQGGKDEL
ncbi:GDP-fucose protein O-fucosyltransferase 1 [Halotydeus destructor]|nr:GDP-fucose protein O-fucosyltransferase 1 [Halotydeus destructor]